MILIESKSIELYFSDLHFFPLNEEMIKKKSELTDQILNQDFLLQVCKGFMAIDLKI